MSTLAEQIAVFQRDLPDIRREHGSAWAVVVDDRFQSAFPEFDEAAHYALENFGGKEFLIRHTDGVVETLPFLLIDR